MRNCVAVLVLLFVSAKAVAQFEGVIEMKMTSSENEMSGEMKMMLVKSAMRIESNIKTEKMPVKMTMLMKLNDQDKMYMLNDEAKTYTELNLKEARERSNAMTKDRKVTVKKLGKEKILGYNCDHIMVTQEGLDEGTEMWVSKDVIDYSFYEKFQAANQGGGGNYAKALKDAGADGFPLKTVSGKVTSEVTKITKGAPAAAMFEIPKGYKQVGVMENMMNMMSPEQRKQMEESMKNMTPEQRKMMEEMMKGKQPK
ncbi:MAG: hypothetical protein HY22_05630 [[Candidatus Thermochlorobacteriaceae] bacterium GBChlB]|nr:MAG: hypothetical protein HY22_05630 [[Candidatus Thermochlorobacteriaceae] bacterium GBChlB]